MKFNWRKNNKPVLTNYEGEKAFSISKEMELYTAVVTSTLENKFNESGGDRLERIQGLIYDVSPEFVAKLAVYAREQMNLRSIPLVLAVELTKIHNGDDLVRKMVKRVIGRADEITEILAYYQMSNGRDGTKKLNKLSRQFQKGIADAFNKFDGYQFAKYNRKAEVSLKDALFLVHPKAKNETQQVLFNQIAQDELVAPYTWEVELSNIGQGTYASEAAKQSAKKEKWQELIMSGRLGYMALMRNLRNILQAKVAVEVMDRVVEILGDEQKVRRSRQLPFRFLAAYQEIASIQSSDTGKLLEALERAIGFSAANIQGFGASEHVVIACDVSGSMWSPISRRSCIQNYDIGLLLGMILQNRVEKVTTGLFGDRWKAYSLPKQNILANVERLKKLEGEVGYSTNGYKVIQYLLKKRLKVDKVMMFTDCQMWNSRGDGTHIQDVWKHYKQRIAPEAKLYLFDLAGYGNTPLDLKEGDVHLIAGWSDKVFEVMEGLRKGEKALNMINKIDL
ncbi:MAG: TROVE domain-containing protein [Bacteroidota bacterium]